MEDVVRHQGDAAEPPALPGLAGLLPAPPPPDQGLHPARSQGGVPEYGTAVIPQVGWRRRSTLAVPREGLLREKCCLLKVLQK